MQYVLSIIQILDIVTNHDIDISYKTYSKDLLLSQKKVVKSCKSMPSELSF